MPFIPSTAFGIAYLGALLVCGCIAWRSGKVNTLIAIMAAHWVTMRAIAATDHLNQGLWVAHDVAMVAAMLFIGRTLAAKAIAVLFFVALQFDLYSLLLNGAHVSQEAFEATASVGETIGYISMLIMAGAGYVDGGKARRSGLGGLGGRWDSHSSASIWRPLPSGSRHSSKDMGLYQESNQ
jgi:hypothetical protein